MLLLEDFPLAVRVSVTGDIGTDDLEPTRRVIHNMTVKLGDADVTAQLTEVQLDRITDAVLENNQ